MAAVAMRWIVMKRLSLFALIGVLPVAASAQSFSESFDVNNTSLWKFNSSIAGDLASDNTGGEANFFFDYGKVGIPSAPHSTGGTTIGLKLESNVNTAAGSTTGVFSGVSVSPIGKTFSGDYTLSFDAWQNFTGPLPGGGSGTTQALLGGVGSAEGTAQFPGGTFNGVGFAATADGGSSQDYRAYTAPGAPVAVSTGAYAAGTSSDAMNSSNAYYSAFQGTVPQAQTDYALNSLSFSAQSGTTSAGVLGFAWHTWSIGVSGTTVTWSVDGKLIATVANANPAGTDIFLGQFDTNGSASNQTVSRQLNFGLIDNVKVTPVPEPASMVALGMGALAMLRRRKKA